ncbi:DUF5682 family protein [Streptomyces sp. NPDC005805]|uniref:DUF5682 family protein n=1 Tax=Streptomyces sp. NPDC005805 TaxID=3157068 RepID=UPI0033D5D2D9
MTGRAGPLLLGVRHHGPGSARAVRAALDAARPPAVLIEGPPEADALVEFAADEGMRPPVALLAHAVDDPGRSAFWPFAGFSPEWVALRWALARSVPVRFVDLPAAHSLALSGGEEPAAAESADGGVRIDPIGVLARTAGHDDPERWWEDVVEHRGPAAEEAAEEADARAPFAVLAEAMTALREEYGHGGHEHDLVREAHMRLRLRAARKEFGDGVAVVCGAWHVPALMARTTATADRALLKGLPKVRTQTTWVPWTHRRLARSSGYGAGIASPGWYAHLFTAPDRPVERWMARVAGLLREEGRAVSPAHVIEAVRLAETLAVVRGRPLAGLGETTDAVRAVMCDGSDIPLGLVADRLVVGDVLGEVPDGAPAVPLQRDLARRQRSLRLRPEAGERELDLDLRGDHDTARSRLLHRLRLLGVGWGEPTGRGGTGTFRESWRLRWEPELSVRVAEAGVWGTTVLAAATAKAESEAVSATTLAAVTALAEQCLLAGLPDALPVVMAALADRAALDTDVGHLAQALPALARALRYGDVRGTDTAALAEVASGLAERVCVGLPPACTGLDADAAARMRDHIDAVHTAIGLLPDPAATAGRWRAALRRLVARDSVPGGIRGRAARLLLDDGRLAEDEAARIMARALSPAVPPAEAAAWIEGFIGTAPAGGLLLVHDERLLSLVDAWLTGVPTEAFTDVLPLLRRTFGAFEPGARRTLGELARRGPAPTAPGGDPAPPAPGFGPGLAERRAAAALGVVGLILTAGRAGGAAPARGTVSTQDGARAKEAARAPDTAPAQDTGPARGGVPGQGPGPARGAAPADGARAQANAPARDGARAPGTARAHDPVRAHDCIDDPAGVAG